MKKNNAELSFKKERDDRISKHLADTGWIANTKEWLKSAFTQKYMYNFLSGWVDQSFKLR